MRPRARTPFNSMSKCVLQCRRERSYIGMLHQLEYQESHRFQSFRAQAARTVAEMTRPQTWVSRMTKTVELQQNTTAVLALEYISHCGFIFADEESQTLSSEGERDCEFAYYWLPRFVQSEADPPGLWAADWPWTHCMTSNRARTLGEAPSSGAATPEYPSGWTQTGLSGLDVHHVLRHVLRAVPL
jgi:hypothetical protein